MIQTLYTIGKVLSQEDEYQKYFEPYENPFRNEEKAKTAKVLVIEANNGIISTISIEPFSTQKINKYLFRSIRGANGTNLVPTFYFQLSGIVDKEKWEKAQVNNIRKLVKKINQSVNNYGHQFINGTEIERLNEMLLLKSADLNKDDAHLITMRVDGKYFGEFEQYRELFASEAYGKYYDKSKAKNKVCSVSYQEEEEVWGRIDTLGFTVDKNAFRRNGFSGKASYTMLPVSPEATKILEGSKKIVDDKLTRKFFNLNYFILPHFIMRDNEDAIERILETFIDNYTDGSFETTGKSIIYNETILNAIVERAELQENIYYDILFFQQQQAQFLIKLQLADVLPSRIKRIFEIKAQVENKYDKITKIKYQDKKTKEVKVRHFHINFGVIKDYFSKKVKTDYVFQPYFFKVLEAVFQGGYLNEQLILKAFMNKIRSDFKNMNDKNVGEFAYQNQTKYTFVLYQYFSHLGLFKNKKNMEKQPEQSVPLTAEHFIKEHPVFFDDDYKKGIFLLGNLSAYLMGKQYKKLKSTPFMKQLNSLNIDEKTIKNIFPKLINKLREYDTAVPELEQQIAQALVSDNRLSKTDISYTFTLGLVMQKEFAKAYNAAKKETASKEPA